MAMITTVLHRVRMDTPLVALSGIFGIEYHQKLAPKLTGAGAVVTKSVTLKPRAGNPEPRIIETAAGLLNSIGLQNPGVHAFIKDVFPDLRNLELPIIGSVAGFSVEEYVQCSSLLAAQDGVDAVELNVSCPNVEAGIEFGCDARMLYRLVTRVRKVMGGKTLIVKLTPNVSDIAIPAKAAIDGGADAVSLINTVRGMAIDVNTRSPKLGNRVGGLSGRAIHPIAVYMVHRCYTECCKKHNIPIIGIGGVYEWEDAIELMLAGATCVGIGTAMFRDEQGGSRVKKFVFRRIAEGMEQYLKKQGKPHISEIVGEVR